MRKLYKHIVFLFILWGGLFMGHTGNAQTFVIPDPNFRQLLQDSLPGVLDVNGDLIIANAAAITSVFNGQNRTLNSVEGLQYFTSLVIIKLEHNNLTSLPDLSPITTLERIYLDHNQLHSLPSFTANTELRELKCDNNNLTALPSFAGLTKFVRLFCRNNQLSALPDFTGCTALYHIICSFNQVTSLPDFSANPNFDRLICHNNRISSVPDYSLHPTFGSMLIERNQLTFDDVMIMARHPNFVAEFSYRRQNDIVVPDHYVFTEGTTLHLDLAFDDTVTTNTYYWYRNDILLATTTDNELIIPNAGIEQAGTYRCTVTNSANPAWASMEINTVNIEVDITPCMFTNQLNYKFIEHDCKTGASIQIDESAIINGQAPFSYKLYNTISKDTTYYTDNTLSGISYGIYDLIITDQNQCKKTVPQFFNLPQQAKCDVIITPDGDGHNDAYFIDDAATVKIYNANGGLIKTINGPTYWDGRDQNGQLVPVGLYLLIMDQRKAINVTVVY